jgi:glycine/D-amino acid oxidase-like deaminating enzyme
MLLSWFEAGYEHVASPGFIYDLDEDFYYGFPRIDGRTIKIAGHRLFETMREPEEKDTAPMSKARIERLRDFVQNYLPCVVRPEVHRTANCIYTMTPDENFILDKHPKHPEIVIAAGFSGHGFKFAPVVGEIAADLAIEGQTRHAIDFMRLKRFYATI